MRRSDSFVRAHRSGWGFVFLLVGILIAPDRSNAYQEEQPTVWSSFRFSVIEEFANEESFFTFLPEWTPWENLYGPLSIRASLGLSVIHATNNVGEPEPLAFFVGRGILSYDLPVRGLAVELSAGIVTVKGFSPYPIGGLGLTYKFSRPLWRCDSIVAGMTELFLPDGDPGTAFNAGLGFTF